MRVLECLIATLGADRIMMGSGSPFPLGDREPMRIGGEAERGESGAGERRGSRDAVRNRM